MTTLLTIPCVDVLNTLRMRYDDLLELEHADATTDHYHRDVTRCARRLRLTDPGTTSERFAQARAERRIIQYLLNAHMSRLAFPEGNDRPAHADTLAMLDRHVRYTQTEQRTRHANALNLPLILRNLRNELASEARYDALPERLQ